MKLSISTWIVACAVAGYATAANVWGDSDPITLEQIVCTGNAQTSCDYLIGQSSLKVGEILQDEAVQTAKYRLQLLGNFNNVELKLDKGSERGKAILTIAVSENSPYSMYVTALASNPWYGVNGVFDTTLVDRNLTGKNDPLSLRLKMNEESDTRFSDISYKNRAALARLEYTYPFVSIPRLYLTAGVTGSVNFENSAYNDGYSVGYSDLDYNDQDKVLSGDIALGYRIFDYSYVSVGAIFGKEWYSSWNPGNGYLIGVDDNQSGSNLISGFFVQYGWDSQDDPNFPTSGSKFQFFLADSIVYGFGYANSFFNYGSSHYSDLSLSVGYKLNYALNDTNVLSLELGNFRTNDRQYSNEFDALLGLKYSHYFARHADNAVIKNGAWYVEPGVFNTGLVTGGGGYLKYPGSVIGARAGAKFETSLGIVNLGFLAGSQN